MATRAADSLEIMDALRVAKCLGMDIKRAERHSEFVMGQPGWESRLEGGKFCGFPPYLRVVCWQEYAAARRQEYASSRPYRAGVLHGWGYLRRYVKNIQLDEQVRQEILAIRKEKDRLLLTEAVQTLPSCLNLQLPMEQRRNHSLRKHCMGFNGSILVGTFTRGSGTTSKTTGAINVSR